MTPEELKFWTDNLNQVHEHMIKSIKHYEDEWDKICKGISPNHDGLHTAFRLAEVCRNQLTAVQRKILEKLTEEKRDGR